MDVREVQVVSAAEMDKRVETHSGRRCVTPTRYFVTVIREVLLRFGVSDGLGFALAWFMQSERYVVCV